MKLEIKVVDFQSEYTRIWATYEKNSIWEPPPSLIYFAAGLKYIPKAEDFDHFSKRLKNPKKIPERTSPHFKK